MDRPALPTAADLGISDEEYERILRDMRRSGRAVPLPPLPQAPAEPTSYSRLVLLVLALVVGLLAVLASRPEPEPEYAFSVENTNGQPSRTPPAS